MPTDAQYAAAAAILLGEVEIVDTEPPPDDAPQAAPRRMTIVDALAILIAGRDLPLKPYPGLALVWDEAKHVVDTHVRQFLSERENPQPPAHGR